ncbi:unnamed protein product [Vitrella brassicaformis CCMP3155]|uniref:Nucleotide-diphospho-sugar transferase domain-containing protein n=2 Tax=Vitrella brassicaformis TaxID=1169539 RepID=A0A0G4EEV9_VITBC|nr:unnamed protein product [Vitrella brassicaformis CCMP3155]|eukprot:CEL94551.1 unnamed protein product [Vitrella brassicaformis CCMP3155]
MLFLLGLVFLPSLVSSGFLPVSTNNSNAIGKPRGVTAPVPDLLVGCHSPFHALPFPVPLNYKQTKAEKQAWLHDYDQHVAYADLPYRNFSAPEVPTTSAAFPKGVFPRKLYGFNPDEFQVFWQTQEGNILVDSGRLCGKKDGDSCMPHKWPRDVLAGPVPHYWQMNLLDTEQIQIALNNLDLPLNHFTGIWFHNCHRDMFFEEAMQLAPDEANPGRYLPYRAPNQIMWMVTASLLAHTEDAYMINTIFPALFWQGEPCECAFANQYCAFHSAFGREMCWPSHSVALNFDMSMSVLEGLGWRIAGGVDVGDYISGKEIFQKFATIFQRI